MKTNSIGIWGNEEYYINSSTNLGLVENINVYIFCHSRATPGYKFQNYKHSYFVISLILKGKILAREGKLEKYPGIISISDSKQSGKYSQVGKKEPLERYFILVKSSPFIQEILLRMFPRGLPSFKASNINNLKYYFEAIRDIISDDINIDNSRLSGLFFSLLSEIQKQQTFIPVPPKIEDAISFIRSHYSERTLTRSQIASHTGMSIRSFSDLFLMHTGTTLTKYINSLRIEKVRQMLLFSNKAISEIADECGFSYAYYMIKKFKSKYELTPKKYREKFKLQRSMVS